MGFLLSEKTYFQIPYLCSSALCLPGQFGRPDRSTAPSGRSTGSVDRCAQTCTLATHCSRSTGPVDRVESSTLRMFRSTGPVDR